MKLRFAPAVSVAVLLFAGCGGSSQKASSSTATPATTSSTVSWAWPPVTVAPNTNDLAKASSISLAVTDLPAGWDSTVNNPTTAPSDNNLDEAFVQCMFGENPSPLTAYVASPDTASEDGSTLAQSFVRVVQATANARTDFSNFKPARAALCEEAMYQRQLSYPAGVKVIGKKFAQNPPGNIPSDTLLSPDNSSDVLGIRFLVSPLDAPQVYEDMFAYGAGRFETVVLFQCSKANPDNAVEESVIKTIKARALAAAKSA